MISLCLYHPYFHPPSLCPMNLHLILAPLCHFHLLLLVVLIVSSNQMSNSQIFIFTTQPRLLPTNLLLFQVRVTLWLGIFPMQNSHQNIGILFMPSPLMWNLNLWTSNIGSKMAGNYGCRTPCSWTKSHLDTHTSPFRSSSNWEQIGV